MQVMRYLNHQLMMHFMQIYLITADSVLKMRYNRVMMRRIWLIVWLLGMYISAPAAAVNNSGAYLEPTELEQNLNITWLVPPYATVSIVDETSQVYAAYIDSGTGSVITALPYSDIDNNIYAAFYSDGAGLSSRNQFDFSQNQLVVLLPPTIYSTKPANSLGFIGSAHPTSTIEIEITTYTNEKIDYVSLADNTGEWQLFPVDLQPGKYQAKARAVFSEYTSAWSQIMYIEILTPLDQAIEDLGKQTRSRVEDTIDKLPDPLQGVARTLDDRSAMLSQLLLPSLLTLTTVAQSGLILQNLFYLLYQAFIWLFQVLGLRKKRLEVGVVYDAISKKPIGRAIVRLYESTSHRLVETDVTSAEGTFSFLPPEGYYYLRVSRPGYVYPTRLILSKRDGTYVSVYTGSDLEVTAANPVIRVAVPLDPEEFKESWQMKVSRFWQRWFEPVNQWLLLFGFFLAILSYSRDPSRVNIIVLLMYVMALVYYFLRGKTFNREYGLVVSDRGKPLSGIELNLVDVEFNRLVSRRVTDGKGRYQFLVPPGSYQIKMATPGFAWVKGIKKAYQGEKVVVAGERGSSKRLVPKIVLKTA
jgi:hypothetical protein